MKAAFKLPPRRINRHQLQPVRSHSLERRSRQAADFKISVFEWVVSAAAVFLAAAAVLGWLDPILGPVFEALGAR